MGRDVKSHSGAGGGEHSCRARLGRKLLNFASKNGAFWRTYISDRWRSPKLHVAWENLPILTPALEGACPWAEMA